MKHIRVLKKETVKRAWIFEDPSSLLSFIIFSVHIAFVPGK
jgi:hypothetical protein